VYSNYTHYTVYYTPFGDVHYWIADQSYASPTSIATGTVYISTRSVRC